MLLRTTCESVATEVHLDVSSIVIDEGDVVHHVLQVTEEVGKIRHSRLLEVVPTNEGVALTKVELEGLLLSIVTLTSTICKGLLLVSSKPVPLITYIAKC
jgi:hypothetical protein